MTTGSTIKNKREFIVLHTSLINNHIFYKELQHRLNNFYLFPLCWVQGFQEHTFKLTSIIHYKYAGDAAEYT
jgi:hypothetical protein